MSIVKGYVQTDLGQIHYRKKRRGTADRLLPPDSEFLCDVRGLHGRVRWLKPHYCLGYALLRGSYDPIDEPTMDQYADQMVDAMRGLGIGKAHLLGTTRAPVSP